MSAIKQLKAQATSATQNVVDMAIRHLLAKALTDSGKFESVHTKMDSRRGSLSVKVRATRQYRNAETLVAIAKKAGMTIQARLTSGDYAEATFKIEQLYSVGNVAQDIQLLAAQTTQNKLVQALTATQGGVSPSYCSGSVSVTLSGVSLGYISDDAAAKIRALVLEDQKPKTVILKMVNLNRNAPEFVAVPTNVGDAVKNKVPSFNFGSWTVKSTSDIVIVRNSMGGHWVVI